MLSTASVTTMLPVKDIDRARAFYEGCLGLAPGGFKPDGKFVYSVGGSTLALFPKPDGTKATTPPSASRSATSPPASSS
nr:VOC family protein [Hydrogenophaga flava]